MAIRILKAGDIEDKIVSAINYLSFNLDSEVIQCLNESLANESNEAASDALRCLIENSNIAPLESIPLCQDTGSFVVFAYMGNELNISGPPLPEIIDSALAKATLLNNLRASVLDDPLFERRNTTNNTPAIVHIRIVEGRQLKLLLAQKGGGAENMSRLKMFTPSASPQEIVDFVVETIRIAGAKACPPLIVGIGIGGNFETCAIMAKEALFSPLKQPHQNPLYAKLEQSILAAINATGIGVQGMGGSCTALTVHIIDAPCHIASLPVAVNLQCHSHRHYEVIL